MGLLKWLRGKKKPAAPTENEPEEIKCEKVSQEYYEEHLHTISPVITWRDARGYTHQDSVLLFRCDGCGDCYEYYQSFSNKVYQQYENKYYCPKCWEKMLDEPREACRVCGKPLTIRAFRNQYHGMCRECWIKELSVRREKYAEYRLLFEKLMKEKGIVLRPAYTDGLDETGRPPESVADQKIGTLQLRDDEYALYLFDAGDGVFAFPATGISIRYVKAPSNKRLRAFDNGSHRLLAAGSDGKDLYLLTERGKLISSAPGSGGNKEGEPLFDPLSYCMDLAEEKFTEEEIAAAVNDFCSGWICEVDNKLCYDPEAKKFFMVLADGNYAHGYDVSYKNMSKEEVLSWVMRHKYHLSDQVGMIKEGKVPPLVVIAKLPWEDGPYTPPENYGYGRYFA